MNDEEHIPTLIRLMYGERAGMVSRDASPRLKRWCAAFEAWLLYRLERSSREARRAWKGLLGLIPKAPWEITEADVEQYAAFLQARAYANSTIKQRLREVERFYERCDQHRLDGEDATIFNPAVGVPKPRVEQYGESHTLSAAEARQLLAAVSSDDSILSRRDYAFFLARLLLGVRLKYLLELKWGQIQQGEEQAWVVWDKGDAQRMRLPEAVWGAIQSYLQSSGRLEGIQPEEYIFAPLADPLHQEASGKAEDWNGRRAIHERTMTKHLKRFGRLAGIPEEKLKLATLRHTASLLRLEAGDDPGQIQEFLHRSSLNGTHKYLANLVGEQDSTLDQATPQGEAREVAERSGDETQQAAPARKPHRFEPWESMTHGLYARSQPPEELAAMLAENVQGLEQEIEGLRLLNRALFEMFDLAGTNQEQAQLAEVSARSETRLAEMVQAKKQLAESHKGDDQEVWLRKRLEKLAHDLGSNLLDWGAPGAGDAPTGELAEGIARLRLGLRRIFGMAMETENFRERLRYADLYGVNCIKLVKLLRAQTRAQGNLGDWWRVTVDQALKEAVKEMNLRI